MSLSKKLKIPVPWFWIGMAAVFLLSVYLRFWGLSRFNTLVFDEVYYAKFANDYLTRTQFFNAHPPLSQYLIAIGIWIGSHLPFGQDAVNSLTGSLRSTWSYRWLNALTGSFIPLVVAGIAYQISRRYSFAFIAALLAASDGLFLVESRYALNNVYLVLFGLLGQWFFLLALEQQCKRRGFWLTLAGIGFGASAAIKWNGLWFLLGAYLVWITAWVIRWVQGKGKGSSTPLQNLTQLNVWHILFFLAIIPVLTYSIAWIPHLQLNPTPGFWEAQKRILEYHERIGSGPKVHPYCSRWYTWLLMIRPVAYFYQTAQTVSEPLAVIGPPLPTSAGKVLYDVHALGNPALWWLSTAAILFLLCTLTRSALAWLIGNHQQRSPLPTPSSRRDASLGKFRSEVPSDRTFRCSTPLPTPQRQEAYVREQSLATGSSPLPTPHSPLPSSTWIALYLVLNWLANLLPWLPVTRCTFLYHYMGSSVFAGLAIAWLVDQGLSSYRPRFRALGVTAIFLVLLAFVFWMPIYLGLPLSSESYKIRMWFNSWI